MKRIYFSIIAFLILGIGIVRSDGYKSIVLKHLDGSETAISAEDNLTLSIKEGRLKLTCQKGEIEVPVSDLTNWSYSSTEGSTELWSGIAASNSDSIGICVKSDGLYLSNLAADSPVGLYDLDGRVIFIGKSKDSVLKIDTKQMGKGFYLLTYNNKTFKIALTR